MTTFESETDCVNLETQERSSLATASLICSCVLCCPISTIIGPILGLVSLIRIKKNPQLKGSGMAISAIIVGVIATVISIAGIVFLVGQVQNMIKQAGTVTTTAIQAGYDGDYETFRTHISARSATVSDEEIEAFIAELQSRYGQFDSATLDMQNQAQTLEPTATDAPIPILLVFEETDVSSNILCEIVPKGGLNIQFKIHCIVIYDPVHGNLVFPKGSDCDSSTTPPVNKDDS